ncbi:helix-turn-helix domain-containing protein [Methylocella tundrae]|uniref:helix-turn-helix domain-containing protein n=1 Tax=Methylocella tundrae TaxID=227605 RepID=UPI002ADEB0A6|nr:short-chain fatty acyl-CoA regulator family protein [Methylocella tundrae]WPP03031.1 short-chain fatty acyl-CoA regulator family protein [Methylocella tundrae]
MKRKLFAGDMIRVLREARGWTQLELAKRMGVSSSYLSQIEANQRSLSGTIVVELARVLRVSVAVFSDDDSDRLVATLRELLGDPVIANADVTLRELKAVSLHAPRVARALVDLHALYKRLEEKYRNLDEALQAAGGSAGTAVQQSSFDEVRDFFHFIGNYVDGLDHAAEDLAAKWGGRPEKVETQLPHHIESRYGISVIREAPPAGSYFVSRLEPERKRLVLNDALPLSTQCFALARHLAFLAHSDKIDALTAGAAFRGPDAAEVCAAALANYFAGALLMPYGPFQEEARRVRHDVERLATSFNVSMEQVCHRLSTLQRPGHEGVPIYFLRVDRAGNITKRHSATRFQFARYGGACPIWNIHEAFEAADRFLVQAAEMPDGVRYLSIARAISKGEARFDALRLHYAIGFGCELAYASDFVYSDAIDLRNPSPLVKIGVSCRLCDRADCHQRAMPPIDRRISVDPNRRGIIPYQVE